MELTLREAAQRLGQSIRQLRYLIDSGRVRARKRGGVWFVDVASEGSAKHPTDPPTKAAATKARTRARMKHAVENILGPDEDPTDRRYSLRDLKAFQIASPLYAEVRGRLELKAKGQRVVANREPCVFLGYRVSRSGISPARKLRRRFEDRVRAAAARGPQALERTLAAYHGLLSF